MTVLLHLSDTHFGSERRDAVEALVALAHEQKPDVAVLSGDITQRARRGQFDAASRFIERLAAPVLLALPGNHDIPLFNVLSRIARPYAGYSRVFGADLEPAYESRELLIACVNTTRPSRHVDGEVSSAQVERTAQRLAAAKRDQLRIVVTHQPIHVVDREDEKDLLHGCREAALAWAKAGADLVLGGHIHLPFVRRIADVERAVWAVQAGTAVSSRVRGGVPNSVNMVRYESGSGRCAIERWDLRGRFERVASTPIMLER
jgi:3',5'-cyclic AMP phosphodiesterase CpdA